MKKLSTKQRERDIRFGLLNRQRRKLSAKKKYVPSDDLSWITTNNWINKQKKKNLNIEITNKRQINLSLPEKMNFFDEYESTVLHISAIRELSEKKGLPRNAYKLVAVKFDNLKKISTSAALVLTAELSKWDDTLRQKLRPMVNNWDEGILKQFTDLGFFNLFQNSQIKFDSTLESSSKKLVQYIKGRCGDSKKTRILRTKLNNIVGDNISKWTFLRSGLDEAITNVSHHAYPNSHGFSENDKNWYLTGSYNNETKELKIVFYDQGIGIPKSLPASDVWEKILFSLSKFSIAERKRDEVLLKAAVELDRTSTKETDRGKGLQDLLEFIRQRENGYISILSLKGLYKFSMRDGKKSVKTEYFDNAICGTLIIWSATLQN